MILGRAESPDLSSQTESEESTDFSRPVSEVCARTNWTPTGRTGGPSADRVVDVGLKLPA